MPYIKPTERELVDGEVDALLAAIKRNWPAINNRAGVLNYALTRLAVEGNGLGWHKSYDAISDGVKALECAKLELYRRVAAPYEDIKAKENGDVYP